MQYTWTFPQLIVEPVQGTLPNVVIAINWVCTGTDGITSASQNGTVRLEQPSSAGFIPYDDISHDIAMQWVSGKISIKAVQKQIETAIANASKPIVVSRTLVA